MLDAKTPKIGDNNPPPYDPSVVDGLNADGAAFLETAALWLEAGDLASEEDAQRLNDFIDGVKKRAKIADDARKDAKKPHDDAGKAVQAAFKPVIEKMEMAKAKVQPILTKWLTVKEQERLAEIARQEKEAQFAREEAERKAAAAAARNDISGEVDAKAEKEAAEAKAQDVARAAKQKSNVSSATGGGRTASLRDVIEVEVTNARALFMRYSEHPDLVECLRNLAAREARTKEFDARKDTIPGAKITVTQKAV